MGHSTHIRIGGVRIRLNAGGTLRDPAEGLEYIARCNLRALQADPKLREEALRRVLSPPCSARCYVQRDAAGKLSHDCTCSSGFQYGSDEHAQDLEDCPARDVWSDVRSLIAGHNGRADLRASGIDPALAPIVADCDDVTPAGLAVCAWIAWFAPRGYGLGGVGDLGSHRNDAARFAVGITLPAQDANQPSDERMAHAYGLTTLAPPPPQPDIRMGRAGLWRVWDPAAHWGMKRPPDSYYDATRTGGEVAIFELRRDHLEGLSPSDM